VDLTERSHDFRREPQPIVIVAGIPKLVIRFSTLHPIFASTG
jgi:hypothetical protein